MSREAGTCTRLVGVAAQGTVMTNRDFLDRPHVRTASAPGARVSAGHLLVVLRRNRIPCSIDSFSDSGWTARLGEPGNGPYSQQGCFLTRQDAADWLLQEAERMLHRA